MVPRACAQTATQTWPTRREGPEPIEGHARRFAAKRFEAEVEPGYAMAFDDENSRLSRRQTDV